MSTLFTPLSFGPLDAGILYTIVPVSSTQGSVLAGFLSTYQGNGLTLQNNQVIFDGTGQTVFTSTDQVFSTPAATVEVVNNSGGYDDFAWPVQNFTVKKFTATSSLYVKSTGAASVQFTSDSGGATPVAHGLSVGDRFWISDANNATAARVYTIATVPTSSTATFVAHGFLAQGFASPASQVVGKQIGRTLGDLPINGTTSNLYEDATRGVSFDYPILLESGAPSGPISAANVPDGLGLSFDGTTNHLTGTPVEFGLFPVILISGNMQRYLALRIEPGTYDSLITSASTAAAIATRAFSFQCLCPSFTPTDWYLDGSPSGINVSGSGLLQGSFNAAGVFSFDVIAVDATHRVTKTMTVTVSPDVPSVSAPYSALTFDIASFVRIPFSATNAPTSWAVTGLPAGLAFDTVNGVVTGNSNAAGIFIFSVTASNATGTSQPFVVTLTISQSAAAGPLGQWLPWLHSDATIIDLQVDTRTRNVGSYYGAFSVKQFDGLKIGLVLWNNGVPVTGATNVRLIARPVNKFDAPPLLQITSFTAETSSGNIPRSKERGPVEAK